MNIPGVCNYSTDTTVLAHFPSDIYHTKSTDLSAGFLCSDCHDAVDRRTVSPMLEEDREFYMRRSQVRTLHVLVDLGLVRIKGVA